MKNNRKSNMKEAARRYPKKKSELYKEEVLEKIKALDESFVTSDGRVNAEAIGDFFGESKDSSWKQAFQLNFGGKGPARSLINIPCTKELKFEAEQSSTCFRESENIVLRGDNLDALKLIRESYKNKINVIYIDPPYNKRNQNFVYWDNFSKSVEQLKEAWGMNEEDLNYFEDLYKEMNHSGWLAFMYPRLKLARHLLAEDGVIFISIDDDEQAHLKIICDEIFGSHNFRYCLSVVNCLNGNNNSSGMMETHEYCLMYSKSKSYEPGTLDVEEEDMSEWKMDEIGYWKRGASIKASGAAAPRNKRPNLFFPIYIDEQNLKFSLERSSKYSFELLPRSEGKDMSWRWSKKQFSDNVEEVIVKRNEKGGYTLHKKQRPEIGGGGGGGVCPSREARPLFINPAIALQLQQGI